MLRLPPHQPSEDLFEFLVDLTETVLAEEDGKRRIALATKLWDEKRNRKASRESFARIREALASLCYGSVRCTYCEDSAADEIEHFFPKSRFPEKCFEWENYLFACGPCNTRKGNRFPFVDREGALRDDGAHGPEARHALIDPRREDPPVFIELDIASKDEEGREMPGTFLFLPSLDIAGPELTRAECTIELLDLNREVLRSARENAFGSYRARCREYVEISRAGDPSELAALRSGILEMPHPSVFYEMQRQSGLIPSLAPLFAAAPEMKTWTWH